MLSHVCLRLCMFMSNSPISFLTWWIHARVSTRHFYKVSHDISVEKCGLDDKTLLWTLMLPIFCCFLDTRFSGRYWQSGFSCKKMARMMKNLVILSEEGWNILSEENASSGWRREVCICHRLEWIFSWRWSSNHESSFAIKCSMSSTCTYHALYCNSIVCNNI